MCDVRCTSMCHRELTAKTCFWDALLCALLHYLHHHRYDVSPNIYCIVILFDFYFSFFFFLYFVCLRSRASLMLTEVAEIIFNFVMSLRSECCCWFVCHQRRILLDGTKRVQLQLLWVQLQYLRYPIEFIGKVQAIFRIVAQDLTDQVKLINWNSHDYCAP